MRTKPVDVLIVHEIDLVPHGLLPESVPALGISELLLDFVRHIDPRSGEVGSHLLAEVVPVQALLSSAESDIISLESGVCLWNSSLLS